MRPLLLALLALLALTGSCAGDAGSAPVDDGAVVDDGCFIGDADAPAVLALVVAGGGDGGGLVTLTEGAALPLTQAVRGGYVGLVSVRARNVTCRVLLNAGAIDECGPRVIGREGRPVELVEDADGFGVPAFPVEPTNFANVPFCPSSTSSRDVDGEPYAFELRLTEDARAGEAEPRTHVVELTVVPSCPAGDDDCSCSCDADFDSARSFSAQCGTIHDNDAPPGECG